MKIISAAAIAATLLLARGATAQNLLPNPSFETPGFSGAQSWRTYGASTIYRTRTDGLGTFYAHTGDAAFRIVGNNSFAQEFQGVGNDVFTGQPPTGYSWSIYDPTDTRDITVSGWYLIPANNPLLGNAAGGANAGLKLTFKRQNLSDFFFVEHFEIFSTPATNGTWQRQTFTVPKSQIDSLTAQFPPGPVGMHLIAAIFRTGANEPGEIWWDDLEIVRGSTPSGGNPCPADWNGDLEVNGNDISDYINSWYADIIAGSVVADFNGDGETNGNDISDYINAWYAAIVNGGYCA